MNHYAKRVCPLVCGALVLAGALVGAGAAPVAAQDDEDRYAYVNTSLFGDYVVEGKGAGEDASADFMAEFDYKDGRMCYMLELVGITDFTAAHIHKGGKKENGPPVMEVKLSEDGRDVCAEADVAVMKDIEANQTGYYVNVHTKAFPAGAVRGQLGRED